MWQQDTGETADRISIEAINVARTTNAEQETVTITDTTTDQTDGGIPVAVMPITVNEILPRAQKKGLTGETDMQAP